MNRSLRTLVIAVCLASTLSACGEQKDAANPTASVPPADLQAVVQGNNAFAFDLYAKLAEKPGNKFFSPYSISTALAMTYAGARGNTAREMAQTLHFTLDDETLHPTFGGLIRSVQGNGGRRNYELAVANRLWGDQTLSPEPKFLSITEADYQAGLQLADFRHNAEGERRIINGWVEDKTKNKITELFKPGIITPNTRLGW